jgi:4'-phosphopantetheinyl transferase EntD
MSTKAIESVLRWAKEEHADVERAADDALAELDALRKAAQIIAKATDQGWPTTPMGSLNLQHSFELLAAIAKEHP